MPMFKVQVEKQMRSTAYVVIDAPTAKEAVSAVRQQINNESLKMSNISWDDPVDDTNSLKTYGEVQKIPSHCKKRMPFKITELAFLNGDWQNTSL